MPLAARLKWLFDTVTHPASSPKAGERYSLREAAAAITEAGTPVTDAYLSMLCNGKRSKVSLEQAAGIAKFFGVKVEHLTGDQETWARVEAQLMLLESLKKAGVDRLAFRASGLSPDGLRRVAEVIEEAREAEGLPTAADDQGSL
ncbi:XRE family transcriptional regulator [Nonomuraea dietziae]|uniref:XRE family transcriptional regulator n=1 Tax=Nonomuraea dietziae TaxID=65515 RepID=UPI0033D275FC